MATVREDSVVSFRRELDLAHADQARVSVVIPTLNEARNLPLVLPLIPSWVDEVVIVDGRSTDGTVDVARRCRSDAVIVMEPRAGKGHALRSGFAACTGDIIVFLDADGSTDPREIPAFVGGLLAGADVVVGSRFLQGGGTDDMELYRKAGNSVLTMLVRLGFGAKYTDLCYGYSAFWRDALPFLDGPFTGFEVETVLHIRALRSRLRVVEIPSFEASRIHGVSNLQTVRDGFRVVRAIGREWKLERRSRQRGVRPERSARAARPHLVAAEAVPEPVP